MPPALAEFKHESWAIERGAPSRINSITQTRDGFLWIGSVEGLFQFDGVSFEPIRMGGASPQRLVVSSLQAARAGELWVGLARGRGVAVYRDGRLDDARMPHPSREVTDIEEDAEGGVWVARGGRSTQVLARFFQGHWQEFGPESGLPEQPAWNLHVARDGTIWVVLSHALVYRRPGEPRFQLSGEGVGPRASLTEDAAGHLWISDAKGMRMVGGAMEGLPHFAHPTPTGGTRMLFDRQGDLWTTTWNSGVRRIRAPDPRPPAGEATARAVASFNASAGLTSDQTRALFQDREGNLWIGTELGLDQLRSAPVVVDPDLPRNSPTSYRMAAADDGTVYVADAQSLHAILPGQAPRQVLANQTPAEALCAAKAGGVWLVLGDRVLRFDAGVVERRAKPVGTMAYGCAEDREGRLWMPALDRGLYWFRGAWQRWDEPVPSPSLPANITLDANGRAVVLFRERPPPGVLPFMALDATQSKAGGIEGLLATDGGIVVSGSQGMALQGDPAAALLSEAVAPWASSLNGLAQTAQGETWAIGDAGIVQLKSGDLARALRGGGDPPHRVLGFQDGLNSFVQKAPGAQVAVGGDGRVWFLTRRNVVRIAPEALAPNPVPPPVVVRAIEVNGRPIVLGAHVELPAGTTTAQVAYTALSLTVPGRVRFSHRLLGADDAWSASTPQRQIVLSDLRPGDYRFEVRASNNDGLWSELPATVAITIPATFTQTLGFKLGVALAVMVLIGVVSILRMRQVLARIRDRDAERLRERERISRDMHDTLLQSVQGLLLHFQSVADRWRPDARIQQELNKVVERAQSVLSDSRDRLQGLRRAGAGHGDLEQATRRLIQDHPFAPTTLVTVESKGPARNLRPGVFDELLHIVGEALFNAAQHAHATEVGVHLDHGRRWLTVEIRDNGVGLDAVKLAQALASGHFGMRSMVERARQIGADIEFDRHGESGTRVALRIKAAIAYAVQVDGGRSVAPSDHGKKGIERTDERPRPS
jgi:signal transduction histidine kinase/ligand-binding sensor domain-containing protein